MIEDEIKLAVDSEFDLPDLTDANRGVAQLQQAGTRNLRATYWDTADLRLARNGVTLRHRTGEPGPPWQLKLPVAGDGNLREELAEKGRTDEVPAPLRALVTGWVRTAALAPVATLRTARVVYRVLDPDEAELAELVDDTVSVLDGRRTTARFRELEVERRAADDATMRWLAGQLVDAGAVEGEFTPKVLRALGPAASEPSDLPSSKARTGRRVSAAAVIRAALAADVRRLVEHDVLVRRGAPDSVHQMRVACRRLRSDLRTFGPLLDPEWADELRAELRWLADSLGAARDLEVQRELIRASAGADPLAPPDAGAVARIDAQLAAQEQAALAAVQAALDDPRYAELLERAVEAARSPALSTLAMQAADQAITPLVAGAWRKMQRKGKKLDAGGADHRWHRVRILAKRARYAAEAAEPALGKPAKRAAAAAESIQDLLGEHQDAVVATETLLAVATATDSDGVLAFTCGRLAERERAKVHAVRAAFPTTWAAATTGKATRWLTG